MKFNKWTVGLAAVGVVSLASAARGDEKMSMVNTALSNTTLSGYVDTAATWRPGTDQGAAGGPHIPAYFGSGNDGFSLNAVDIAIDHPEDSSPWAAGYHVELMIGAFPVGAGGIRQAYMTLHTPVGNGLDWKVGMFDTIVGYESNSDPLNPNYTRSYGYSIEPTTHTGVLATYTVNDMVSVSAGVANTSNATGVGGNIAGPVPTTTYESQKTYMGSVAFTAPDSAGWAKGATLTLAVVNGTDSVAGGGSSSSWYAGMSVPTPLTALKVGACFDYLDVRSLGGSEWNVALYSSFQATDKLSLNARAEYFDQNDITGLYSALGAHNSAEEVTLTAQYALWENVLSRVEVRWDHVDHGPVFGSDGTPAGSFPDKNNDFLLALNLIYQF
jgi:Putative beta-barrel porin-2, OmpL-like. bbp2